MKNILLMLVLILSGCEVRESDKVSQWRDAQKRSIFKECMQLAAQTNATGDVVTQCRDYASITAHLATPPTPDNVK
jgi:Tfp pilus assembly protein PilP